MKLLFVKILRDLVQDKRRAAMSLIAILIGSMCFGIMMFSYEIIPRELIRVYDEIIPSSGSVMVDRVDANLILLTEQFEGIHSFEQKSYNKLRVQLADGEWKTLELFSAENYLALEINKIFSEQGSFEPKSGEMLIERDAVKVANAGIGDNLTIALPDNTTKDLTIVGVVNDLILHPATSHNTVYAYVSQNTLGELGLSGNRIDFIVSGDPYDREQILAISNEYIQLLESNGYIISELDVSKTPGLSMHLEEYEAGLFLLRIFSFVTFIFGAMIMSNLISTIVSAQTRQIGILKSIGANTRKITGVYMLAFFIPVSMMAVVSGLLTTFIAGRFSSALMILGNMRPNDTSVPVSLYAIFACLAILIPMIIAFVPVRKGVNISVKDALYYQGSFSDDNSIKLPIPKGLSRPVMLSLRNALQRKRRFLLNVAILSVAGALFVSVVTAMISTQTTLSSSLNAWKFDYQYLTPTVYDDSELAEITKNIPLINAYEVWNSGKGVLVQENASRAGILQIAAPPDSFTMVEPNVTQGSWFNQTDENTVVVSHKFFVEYPEFEVGSTVMLQIGDSAQAFKIAGAMKDFGPITVYMNAKSFARAVPESHQLTIVKLSLNTRRLSKTTFKQLETLLKENGVLILQSQSKADINTIAMGHFAITLQTFLFIICMLVIVSGFGLAATMNTQTSERTKEIGIMKAMGARERQIIRIVTSESIFIALVSFAAAVVIGVPLGVLSVFIFGNLILETPLDFSVLSLFLSYLIWLGLSFAVGYFASKTCAKHAADMSVKESLVFE